MLVLIQHEHITCWVARMPLAGHQTLYDECLQVALSYLYVSCVCLHVCAQSGGAVNICKWKA